MRKIGILTYEVSLSLQGLFLRLLISKRHTNLKEKETDAHWCFMKNSAYHSTFY